MSNDRLPVKTYVPPHQKEIWEEHASTRGMSQSEFIRTMVQAGRRGFTIDTEKNVEEDGSTDVTPGGEGIETRVESLLATEPLDWNALRDKIAGDLDDRLETALDSLQAQNRIRYSGRDGGYMLINE